MPENKNGIQDENPGSEKSRGQKSAAYFGSKGENGEHHGVCAEPIAVRAERNKTRKQTKTKKQGIQETKDQAGALSMPARMGACQLVGAGVGNAQGRRGNRKNNQK